MIRQMTSEHIDQVAHIHATSWSPEEISVKLGEGYLKHFYSEVVSSPHAFGYVNVENDTVDGYCTGFYQYSNFNSEFLRNSLSFICFTFGLSLIRCRMDLNDIMNMKHDGRKLEKLKYPAHHLGALALSTDLRNSAKGGRIIIKLMKEVMRDLQDNGCKGCWGVCDDKNLAMKKVLLKLQYSVTDRIQYKGKLIVVFEHIFNSKQTTTDKD